MSIISYFYTSIRSQELHPLSLCTGSGKEHARRNVDERNILTKDIVFQKEKDAEIISRLLANIERLMDELSEARAEISNLVYINSSQAEQISVLKKHCYGSPSQRNRRS